jgi:antitoxin HicB
MAKRGSRGAPDATGETNIGANPDHPGGSSEVRRSRKEYLNLPYQIALRADERNGGWTAHVEELPGCEAHGDNPEQATRQLRGAMERWVGEALERGEHIPEPRVLSGHSGRLLLRMPQSLHAELAHVADREGISLNQFITTALASAVGWRNPGEPPGRGSVAAGAKAPGNGDAAPARAPRSRRLLLAVNLVVLIVLAALAVALLLTALYEL